MKGAIAIILTKSQFFGYTCGLMRIRVTHRWMTGPTNRLLPPCPVEKRRLLFIKAHDKHMRLDINKSLHR